MLHSCIFCVYFLFTYIYATERSIHVQLGGEIVICCTRSPEENQALIIYHETMRLRSVVRGSSLSQIDASLMDFKASYPGYEMEPVGVIKEQLCLYKREPTAVISDDEMKFRCELSGDRGLGEIVDIESITIRIFDPPKIVDIPEKIEVNQGSSEDVKCSATGRPNLKLAWRNIKKNEVISESAADGQVDGKADVVLNLQSVEPDQDGDVYVCEASTTYPPNQAPLIKKATLSVNYPPSLEIRNATVYTDLGAKEDIAIKVRGKPEPELNCDLMNIQEPREVSLSEDSAGGKTYYLRLHKVQSTDVGNYQCSATNVLGTATEIVKLTLSPSPPEIASPNFTSSADYYLLGWRARSKARLHNVTIDIKSVQTPATISEETGELLEPKIIQKTLTIPLNGTDEMTHEFWHHVPDLPEDTEHRIFMTVCNQHACTQDVGQVQKDLPIDGVPHVVFRTARYDGFNNIDPEVLSHPPSESLRSLFAAQHTNKKPGDDNNSASMVHWITSMLPLVVVSLKLSICL